MDFIERWFKVSPDGGNGTLEMTLLIVALVALLAPFVAFKLQLWRSSREQARER